MNTQAAAPMKHARFAPQTDRSIQGFNHDGIELARRKSHRRGFPLAKFLQFALAIFAIKIFLFMQIGAVAYNTKMHELAEGNLLERVASKAMLIDPISYQIIDLIRFAL